SDGVGSGHGARKATRCRLRIAIAPREAAPTDADVCAWAPAAAPRSRASRKATLPDVNEAAPTDADVCAWAPAAAPRSRASRKATRCRLRMGIAPAMAPERRRGVAFGW